MTTDTSALAAELAALIERLVDAKIEARLSELHRPDEGLSIDKTARAIGVSKGTVYRLIRDGDLPVRSAGTRRVIPRSAVDRYLGRAS